MKSITLMSVQSGSGRKRNCDKICYNAMESKCTCCCQGMNHGKGLKQAAKNTAELATKQLTYMGKKIEVRDGTLYLVDKKTPKQLSLLD